MLKQCCVVLLLATTLLIPATATELVVSAGPWFIEQPDGALRIGFELLPEPEHHELGNIRVTALDGTDINCKRQWQRVQGRSLSSLRYIYQCHLTQAQRKQFKGIKFQGLGKEAVHLDLPVRPHDKEAVRVLCTGSYNYPLHVDIEKIEKELGESIDLVLVQGSGVGARIGKGEWEQRIPIMCMLNSSGHKALDELICGSQKHWTFGAEWGCLGLPSAVDEKHVLTAINRGLHAWQVFIDRDQRWDPGTYASQESRVDGFKRLLALCRRPQLKLILGSGSGSGFISEPLHVRSFQFAEMAMQQRYINHKQFLAVKRLSQKTGQSVRAVLLDHNFINQHQAQTITQMINEVGVSNDQHSLGGILVERGGIRYITTNAGGFGFKPVPDELALPIYQRAHVVLQADLKQLQVHVFRASADKLEISYQEQEPQLKQSMQDAVQLSELPLSEFPDDVMDTLRWQTQGELDEIFNSSSYRLHQGFKWALAHEDGEVLLRRLLQLDGVIALAWLHQQEAIADGAIRDTYLRTMADVKINQSRDFQRLLMLHADDIILRSTLRYMDAMPMKQRLHFIDILIRRLTLQEQGQVALTNDPVLQRDYLACIFDSPYHSPTPLRPLALYAQQQFHEFARGKQSSVQRFLDRYGSKPQP